KLCRSFGVTVITTFLYQSQNLPVIYKDLFIFYANNHSGIFTKLPTNNNIPLNKDPTTAPAIFPELLLDGDDRDEGEGEGDNEGSDDDDDDDGDGGGDGIFGSNVVVHI
ncbi:hypothetical protein RhiirB3_473777, partial [Rhizophagus irregularis]